MPDRPNFVFILVDDWGWKDAHCCGTDFFETPNIDSLAKDGLRFTCAYSGHPVCSPTRAAIMTGNNPARREIDITDWIPGERRKGEILLGPPMENNLALSQVTLGEALQAAGYATWFFGKWHLGETQTHWPEAQGFEVNKGGWSKGSPTGAGRYYVPYGNPKLSDGPPGEYLTDRLTDEAIKMVRQQPKDKPFLVYLSFYTVHTPIMPCERNLPDALARREQLHERLKAENGGELPPLALPEIRGKTRQYQDNAAFASMVRALDQNVGRLIETLKETGQYDNTVILLTGDNGGLSTLRGGPGPSCNLPLRAGKGWCFEGGIRVPLIVRDPAEKKNFGKTCPEPVYAEDYYPTILARAGLACPDGQGKDGVDIGPLLSDPAGTLQRTEPMVWHYPHYHGSGHVPASAIRLGDWKFIENYHDRQLYLFHLKDDPGERTNLAESQPEKAAAMRKALHDYLEKVGASMPTANPNVPAQGGKDKPGGV